MGQVSAPDTVVPVASVTLLQTMETVVNSTTADILRDLVEMAAAKSDELSHRPISGLKSG